MENSKGMIEYHAKNLTKIRYGSRKKVKVIENTTYYKKGRILEPHTIMADQLIKDGIAVEVKD